MRLHSRHTRGAAHQQHATQFRGRDARIVERRLHGRGRALHQVARHVVERGARDGGVEVQGAARVLREERQVHVCGVE